MDLTQAWPNVAKSTKSASTTIANTLDAVSPRLAPFAARWDREADRRRQLRTPEHLKALIAATAAHNAATSAAAAAKTNLDKTRATTKPLSRSRRASAAASRGARQNAGATKVALKEARRSYPDTLNRAAAKIHAAHLVPAALVTGTTESPWPASASAALVVANAAALWLGRRNVVAGVVDDGLSAEEKRLMGRLATDYWVANADDRGLGGTVTGTPSITTGGIVCRVRLDNKWTVKALRAAGDNVRNLLGMRTATRMRITSDREGGWAVISIATRSAADGIESAWTPDRMPADPFVMSLGLDTETGEEVLIPFDERMLVAGASGTGKSWSTRPLMATAHLRGDFVLIDGKGEEANEWDGVCRCAVDFGEIDAVVDEIHDEMGSRKADMKARKISVWDGPQLTVLIDEGQVVLASVGKDKDRLQRLIELSSLGRSRGIVLWWATQKPVMSGGAPGVHSLIAPNLLTRFCLRVADAQEAQTALDDCADYQPQKIDRGKEWRGHGYLKDYGPRMIRTWTLGNEGVRALPSKVWRGAAPEPGPNGPLTLVKGEAPSVDAELTDNQRAVLKVVRDGAASNSEISRATGLNPGSVARAVEALAKRNLLIKNGTAIRLGGAA